VNFVDFGEISVANGAVPAQRGVRHPGGVRFLRNEKKQPVGVRARISAQKNKGTVRRKIILLTSSIL